MATELTMPKNDMDMEEGTIVKWLKNVKKNAIHTKITLYCSNVNLNV